MGKSSPLTYCSMNHANFESLLRHILLVKHYRYSCKHKTGFLKNIKIKAHSLSVHQGGSL